MLQKLFQKSHFEQYPNHTRLPLRGLLSEPKINKLLMDMILILLLLKNAYQMLGLSSCLRLRGKDRKGVVKWELKSAIQLRLSDHPSIPRLLSGVRSCKGLWQFIHGILHFSDQVKQRILCNDKMYPQDPSSTLRSLSQYRLLFYLCHFAILLTFRQYCYKTKVLYSFIIYCLEQDVVCNVSAFKKSFEINRISSFILLQTVCKRTVIESFMDSLFFLVLLFFCGLGHTSIRTTTPTGAQGVKMSCVCA